MTVFQFRNPALIFATALVAASPLCGAESPDNAAPPSAALTLAATLQEAVDRSPMLAVIAAELDAARGEVLTARTKPVPELSFVPGWKHVREADGSHNEFKGTLGFSRTFLFPGKQELLVAIAERNVGLRRLATDGLRFQLTAAVRKSFYELLAAQTILSLRQQQLESAQTFHDAVARRAESGYAADFEAVKSQGDVINAKKLLAGAAGEIAAARVELNALLARDPSGPLTVTGVLDEQGPERSLADLLALAQRENPSLRVLALQADIAALNLRKARLARKPDITVGPSLEYSRSEQVLAFGASIPLPTRNYGQGEVMSASADQRRVQAEAEKLRREIVAAVTKAATQLSTARTQLALYSPAYLEQLKSVVEQAERSYAQNATSLLIYLDAKRTYFDTLADYHAAIAAAASSRAALESAIGAPLELLSASPTP